MDLSRKQRAIKYLCYCALILIAELLQNVAGILPEIFGARCFLLIPCAAILAIGEDELSGALLGLFAGLLWDMTSAVHMGFNCIYFAVFCFLLSALVNHLLRDIFVTNIILSIIGIILYSLIYWLFFIFARGMENADETLVSFYLPCIIYTVLITPIVYIIYKPIKKKLNAKNKTNNN
ncbi:MAG: rod shape-determining protein MreD [Clostridium sp.]|nr:rod shape-determining protein MreD [Clostridium sp.]